MSMTSRTSHAGLQPSRLQQAIQLILLASALTVSPAAHAETSTDTAGIRHSYHISGGSLGQALRQFASNSGLMYSAEAALTDGKTTAGLDGEYSAEEGLKKLLAGTGLTYTFTAEGAVAVRVAETGSNAVSTLPAVTVTGKAQYDLNDPYNTDYNRTESSTATKTDTPIMQTPMSVKVVTQQVLKDQQAVTLDQALRNVSSVVSGSGTDREFFVRGFGTNNYYRDGFPFGNNFYHTEDMANVEKVEVLKGPGSILYGRAEPGGIINFVTKQPLDTPYYSLRQQFGSYNHYRTDIDATGPLTANKDLAYRVNFAYQANDAITQFSGGERIFAAPMLRWNISDKTVSTFKLEYSDIKRFADNALTLDANGQQVGLRSRKTNFSDTWDFTEDEYVMYSMNTTHKFNESWNIRHRFNASFAQQTFRNILPWGKAQANGNISRLDYVGNADGGDYLNNYYNSLELTGKFETGGIKHTLLIGGDYLRSDIRYTNAYPDTPGTNVFNPFHLAQPGPITDYETYHSSRPWFGLYAQDQVELPYNVHLLAGLRYDNATTDRDAQFSTTSAKIIRPTADDDRVSPRGGILWQPIPEVSLYGSYTENFGAVNGFTNAAKTPLPPQTAQQWETGVKTELFEGKFTGTLAYYDLKKQNLQMSDGLGTQRAIGEAESRGIELDLSGEVLPGLKVIGAYAYTPFAKTLKDTEGNNTIGKRLHNVPENSGSLWTTYEFQEEALRGLKLGAGLQAVGRRYIGYNESMKTAGYATLNLMASQMWKVGNTHVTAQLNADNLLDKTYLGAVYSYQQGLYGAPRTFMGSIKIEY